MRRTTQRFFLRALHFPDVPHFAKRKPHVLEVFIRQVTAALPDLDVLAHQYAILLHQPRQLKHVITPHNNVIGFA